MVKPIPSSSRPCFAAEADLVGWEGRARLLPPERSTSCSRKRGTPYSMSCGFLDSNGREAALPLVRATSSSRFSSMKSWSTEWSCHPQEGVSRMDEGCSSCVAAAYAVSPRGTAAERFSCPTGKIYWSDGSPTRSTTPMEFSPLSSRCASSVCPEATNLRARWLDAPLPAAASDTPFSDEPAPRRRTSGRGARTHCA